MTSMFIIKKHNDHNTTSWYHVWRNSIDFVVSWTQRQKVTAKVEEKKSAAVGLTCFEEALRVWMGARSLVITGNDLNAFEYSIPCLQILYSSCQFDISRKSDSSFLSQRGFTR